MPVFITHSSSCWEFHIRDINIYVKIFGLLALVSCAKHFVSPVYLAFCLTKNVKILGDDFLWSLLNFCQSSIRNLWGSPTVSAIIRATAPMPLYARHLGSFQSFVLSAKVHARPSTSRYEIRQWKTHLIEIQCHEIVLIVCKSTSKDGLKATWKCTLAVLNKFPL